MNEDVCTTEREKQVNSEMMKIENSIGELVSAVNELESRLAGRVLTETVPPQPDSGEKEKERVLVGLADEIRARRVSLRLCRRTVTGILQRLEI